MVAIKKFLETEEDKVVKKIALREVKMLKVICLQMIYIHYFIICSKYVMKTWLISWKSSDERRDYTWSLNLWIIRHWMTLSNSQMALRKVM